MAKERRAALPKAAVRPVRRVLAHIGGRMLAGALVLTPAVITFLILRFLFFWLDGVLKPVERVLFSVSFPGLGIGLLLVVLYLGGVLTAQMFTRRGLALLHAWMSPVPGARTILSTVEKLVEFASTAPKFERFQRVVAIEYPRPGIYTIAFATGETVVDGEKRFHNVYIPTPTSIQTGIFLLVPEGQLLETDLTVDDTIKLMLSAGLAGPSESRLFPSRAAG